MRRWQRLSVAKDRQHRHPLALGVDLSAAAVVQPNGIYLRARRRLGYALPRAIYFCEFQPGIAEVARMQRSQGDADAAQDGAGWAGRSPASGWCANEF